MKLFVILLLLSLNLCGQNKYRVVFYNTENLYDTIDDPVTLDDDFTPKGKMEWTDVRYGDKLLKLSKALHAAGGDKFPALIGLAEIENRKVLDDLIATKLLAGGDYEIIHKDSPDQRGIDVAFLYQKSIYKSLQEKFLPVVFPEDSTVFTRDILYTSGILGNKDTIHLFVCHFPSMRDGEEESEWKRERAASVVRSVVDSIQLVNPQAAILIMGDLNGMADRPAQVEVLGAQGSDSRQIDEQILYNTGYYLLNNTIGSYKYRGNWQTIDHIIISGSLLRGGHGLKAARRLEPFMASFLLETEKDGYNLKPFRTYAGPRYLGGYSDHLPVFLDIKIKD